MESALDHRLFFHFWHFIPKGRFFFKKNRYFFRKYACVDFEVLILVSSLSLLPPPPPSANSGGICVREKRRRRGWNTEKNMKNPLAPPGTHNTRHFRIKMFYVLRKKKDFDRLQKGLDLQLLVDLLRGTQVRPDKPQNSHPEAVRRGISWDERSSKRHC